MRVPPFLFLKLGFTVLDDWGFLKRKMAFSFCQTHSEFDGFVLVYVTTVDFKLLTRFWAS